MPRGHWRHRGIEARLPYAAVPFNTGFEPAVSSARLSTYRQIAQNDDHAWELYRWNIDLAAAFTSLACDVEVALRNTLPDRLATHFARPDWWASNDLVLDDITASTLSAVVHRHRRQLAKGTVGPGKIVADLMLGTWVMLLSRGGTSALGRAIDYEAKLWRPALRFGFAIDTHTATGRPRRPTRDAVHQRASNLQRLRNRAAHHEPIFNGVTAAGTNNFVALITVWEESVELLGWMAPDLAALHRTQQALPAVLAARP